jgi:hypothetical protein
MLSLNQFLGDARSNARVGATQPMDQAPASASMVRLRQEADRRRPTRIERTVLNLLEPVQELPLDKLVILVAEALYREELRAGGWAVDVGLFGKNLFANEARRVLEDGNGELWQIG